MYPHELLVGTFVCTLGHVVSANRHMDLLPTWNTGHGLRFRYSYRCMFLWQRDLWSDRHVDPRGWVKQERVWICWRGSNRWVATNMVISKKVIPRISSTNYHMSFVLCWVQSTEQIALKGAMTMPSLLLRKPRATSKAKDHMKCLERQLHLWSAGTSTA